MKVTVYSTTTCPYCVMLKKWLDDKGVEYQEYTVDTNPYAAQMMAMQSGGERGVRRRGRAGLAAGVVGRLLVG